MGNNPSFCLFQNFNNLLADVANRFVEQNIGRRVFVHGSAATGNISLLSFSGKYYFVSDIDIIMEEFVEIPNYDRFESELKFLPQWYLKASWSPAAKVSLKRLNSELKTSLEGNSLLDSLYSTGIPIEEFSNGSLSYLKVERKEINYPYALPYAIYRWLSWAGTGIEGNAAALYELAKGCHRAIKPKEKNTSRSPKILFDNHIRTYVCQHIAELTSPVVGVYSNIIVEWANNAHKYGLSEHERKIIHEQLQIYTKLNMANSILNERLEAINLDLVSNEYRA